MSRPNTHLDEKLIQTGLELISKEGIRALSVRKVCKLANVNLGMFSYFFKDKDTFLKYLFESIYLKIDLFLNTEINKEEVAIEKLKSLFKRFMRFSYENILLVRAILFDLTLDDGLSKRLLKKGIIHPIAVFMELIKKAQNEGTLTNKVKADEIHEILLLSSIVPILFPHIGQFANPEFKSPKRELNYYYEKFDSAIKALEV